MTKDEMVGWHHRLDRHEFEQALGAGEGHGSPACCSPGACKQSDTTEQLSTAHVLAIPKPRSLQSRIEQINKHIVHNFVVIV